MAVTQRQTEIPNRGRKKKKRTAARAKSVKKKVLRPKAKHRPRTKPNKSQLIGYTLKRNGRKASRKTAAKGASMAKTKKAGRHHKSGGHKMNKGRRPKHRSNRGRSLMSRRNVGSSAGTGRVGDIVVNGLFVIAGALGTKLITQMVLGQKNIGFMGYGVAALTGAALWFGTKKLLHNKAAEAGIISGTVVQILLRVLSDYTPFGQYLAQAGMGDYQAQGFLTPQILRDPYNSAEIAYPAALMPAPMPTSTTAGVAGFDPLYSGGSSLY